MRDIFYNCTTEQLEAGISFSNRPKQADNTPV